VSKHAAIRFAAVAALACAVGAAATLVLSSPRVVRVERPPAQLVNAAPTATVTEAVIRERYTFSGKLAAAVRPRSLRTEGVVTGLLVRQGGVAHPGQVLLELNGRPVIGLDLPFPLWRDLAPGTQGKDVSEIQRALGQLGVYGGSITGVYDAATEAALRALYARLGYSAQAELAEDSAEPDGESVRSEADAAATGDKDKQTEDEPPAPPPIPHTVLPAREVASVGGGPWRLDLHGATVGSVLAGEEGPSLVRSGTRLTVKDGGKLARLLADGSPRSIGLVGTDDSARIRATVVSSQAGGSESRVVVKPVAGRLPRGTVAGSAIVRSTATPVTCVPVTALRPTADGRTMIRAVVDGRARDIAVRVGLRGDRLVEVDGPGLTQGMTVELI
jgi:hypothetical protein